MIACTVCLLVVAQSGPSKPLDYTASALPMRVAFKEMSAQTKVPLSVSRELENEPIILRLKDVPLKEAMERIASTVEAEWARTDGGGYRLQRSAAIVARLEREHMAKESAAYKQAIQRQVETALTIKEFDLRAARDLADALASFQSRMMGRQLTNAEMLSRRRKFAQIPPERLLARVIASLDPTWLASLPLMKRLVLSSHATDTQQQLRGYEGWLEAYLHEREIMREAIKERSRPIPFYLEPAEVESSLKLLVTVQRLFDAGALIDVNVFDSKGKYIGGRNSRLQEIDIYQQRIEEEEMARLKADQTVHLPEQSSEIVALAKPWDPTRPKLSSATRQILLNPETHDPLSHVLSHVLLATAELERRNLVAYAPDSAALGALVFCPKEKVTPDHLFKQIKRLAQFDVERQNSWLIGRSGYPLNSLASRIPRPLLGEYLRKVTSRGWRGLDDDAWLLLRISDEQAIWLPEILSRIVARQPVSFGRSNDFARLYGSLTDSQRELMNTGQWFAFGDLLPEQREYVRRTLFDRDSIVTIEQNGSPEPTELERSEITEALPRGLQGNTLIRLERTQADLIIAGAQDGTNVPFERSSDMDSFVTELIQGEVFPGSSGTTFLAAALGESRGVKMTVRVPGRLDVVTTIGEKRQLTDLLPLDRFVASLPEAQRKNYDRLVAEARQRFRKMAESGQRLDPPRQPEQPPL